MFDFLSLLNPENINRLLQQNKSGGNMLTGQSSPAAPPLPPPTEVGPSPKVAGVQPDQMQTASVIPGSLVPTMSQPQTTPATAAPAKERSLWDRYTDFTRSDQGQALGDFFTGMAMGRNPNESLSMGGMMVAQNGRGRRDRNETVEWLKKKGMDEESARLLARNPTSLSAYLQQMMGPQAKDRQFQTLPNGDYGYFDKNAGNFTTLGSAPRPQTSDITQGIADRKKAAAEMGISPDDPMYQPYVLTGKTPREDQQRLTAVDKKAILDADEAIQANQQTIENLRSITSGDPGQSLNDRAGSGWSAGLQSWAARNDPTGFFDDKKGEATTELNNVVLGNTLGQLKATFGAAPTEGERAVLRDLEASVDKSPAERKIIVDRAIKLAENRMRFNQDRANDLRGNTFYQPRGTSGGNGRTSGGLNWSVEP